MKLRTGLKTTSLSVVLFLLFLSFNLLAADSLPKQGDLLYSWINDLRMRNDAGKTIVKLREYESVIYLGKHSERKKRIVLRGKPFHRYNYLVRTNQGKTGWVYGGALKRVTGIKPADAEAARVCLDIGSNSGKRNRMITKNQEVIDGTHIYTYLKSLKHGDIIYQRPIYKSGCAGTLEETCYSNEVVVAEHEGGATTILYGDFAPVIGLKKGMTKAAVLEKLGQPNRQNQRVFIYRSFYYLREKNYQVSIDYYLSLLFDDADRIESIRISSTRHEDC